MPTPSDQIISLEQLWDWYASASLGIKIIWIPIVAVPWLLMLTLMQKLGIGTWIKSSSRRIASVTGNSPRLKLPIVIAWPTLKVRANRPFRIGIAMALYIAFLTLWMGWEMSRRPEAYDPSWWQQYLTVAVLIFGAIGVLLWTSRRSEQRIASKVSDAIQLLNSKFLTIGSRTVTLGAVFRSMRGQIEYGLDRRAIGSLLVEQIEAPGLLATSVPEIVGNIVDDLIDLKLVRRRSRTVISVRDQSELVATGIGARVLEEYLGDEGPSIFVKVVDKE